MAQAEVVPLLVNGRKFDFRAFLVIARAAPRVALFYPGMLRIAPVDYQGSAGTAGDWKAQITNTEYGHTLTMAMDEHYWTYGQLQDYLTEKGLAPPDYVEHTLLAFVKKVMRFTVRAATLGHGHGSYHVFGEPYMYFLEARLLTS